MAPTSHFVLPGEMTPAALLEQLDERLELEPDAAEVVERTYLDTFDGLARDGDATLSWEDGRLVLTDRDERELASGERPDAPAALKAADLPGGELRDRLARLIEVRAALPIARVGLRRRRLRVLDGERKTVARIVIEEPSVTMDGGPPAALSTRLVVTGVRGYDKDLRRVLRVVERDVGLAAAQDTLVDEAVLRTGGRPGGVRSKADVHLDREQRADGAAVAIVTPLLDVVEANLPGALDDVDPEFLHDLRVAVRRTRALQRELKAVFPPDELAHFRREFRRLQEITGPSRDLDVHLLEFDDLAAGLGEEHRGELDPLRSVLRRHRRDERRRMVRALRSARTSSLLAEWRAFVEGLETLPEAGRPDAARPVAEVAARRIAAVYRRMVKLGDAIDADSPATALHELRKKGKELRYLLEFFAGLFDPATVDPMVKRLKALQDTLGRFQDREVQAALLRSLGPEIAAAPGGPGALMAMGVLVEHLEHQQAEARAEFAERFGRFASDRSRAAVKEAFR